MAPVDRVQTSNEALSTMKVETQVETQSLYQRVSGYLFPVDSQSKCLSYWNNVEGEHQQAPDDDKCRDYQLQDDCGNIKKCQVYEDRIVYQEIACNKVNAETSCTFESFSGPCGNYCAIANFTLTTPCFAILQNDCKGPNADDMKKVYDDILATQRKYNENKNKKPESGGINIVVNNSANAANNNSNNMSQNVGGPAAPAQIAPIGVPADESGKALKEADEVLNCTEGPMGFGIDFDAKDAARIVNKVNEGSWAEKKEIGVGDEVITMNGEAACLKTKGEIVNILANVRPVKLGIKKKVVVPDTF